jgi:anaphase-promoting complex subunit 2
MFGEFEELGLIDRYESVIASVGYEHIEAHVLETCTGQWGNTMLDVLRSWMSDKVVPWMLVIYARGAATGGCFFFAFFRGVFDESVVAEEARSMLQGVGSRFDFHINKTLCDLRCVSFFICANTMYSSIYNRTREIFDIIIDFPDSMGALNDLKVPIERLPLFVSPHSPLLRLYLGLPTTRRPTNSPCHGPPQSVRLIPSQSFVLLSSNFHQ